MLAGAAALPALQESPHWRPLVVLGAVATALAVVAVAANVPRLLVWTAVLLSAEELTALASRAHPGDRWALVFAVLLFVGLELSYFADGEATAPRPLDELSRATWPAALAIAAAVIIAAIPRPAFAGVGSIALGLGAAAVLIIVVALLIVRADGASGRP